MIKKSASYLSNFQNTSHNKIIIDHITSGSIYFACLGSSLLAATFSSAGLSATTAAVGVAAVLAATAAVTQWATRLVMKLKSAETKIE